MRQYPFRIAVLTLIASTLFSAGTPAHAQSVKIAVAANLKTVIKQLEKDFKKRTGITVEDATGPSGGLAAQINNGAPFDLFLSADMDQPEKLYRAGHTLEKPEIYAYGKLVICSNQNIGFENWERLLLSVRVKKISIANPAIAPYGKAAIEALEHKGIYGDVKNKIVQGESIAQVNTYITTGNVDLGFTTQSLVRDPQNRTQLYWSEIDQKLYEPIKQGAVILKRGATNEQAKQFYKYLFTAPAKQILKEYGYGV